MCYFQTSWWYAARWVVTRSAMLWEFCQRGLPLAILQPGEKWSDRVQDSGLPALGPGSCARALWNYWLVRPPVRIKSRRTIHLEWWPHRCLLATRHWLLLLQYSDASYPITNVHGTLHYHEHQNTTGGCSVMLWNKARILENVFVRLLAKLVYEWARCGYAKSNWLNVLF